MTLTEIETDPAATATEAEPGVEGRTPLQLALRKLRTDKIAIVSLLFIVFIILMAIFAPLIVKWWGYPPRVPDTNHGLDDNGLPLGPSSKHLLGTDELGRDLFSRAVYGSRVSLFVGLVSTVLATVIGTTVGMLAGYFGGWVDSVISRILETTLSYPYLIVGLVAAATIGQSLTMEISVITFFQFAALARVIRGQVISIKAREFVEAARSLGAGRLRIMFIDILPNLVAPILILGTLLIPTAIVFESTLTFLGAGIDIATPSWGGMLNESQDFYRHAWWYLIVPSVLLLSTTLAFNLLGDSVRDALDPQTGRTYIRLGKAGRSAETAEG